MRAFASTNLPLYLSLGALCAGFGIQLLSPLSTPVTLNTTLPQMLSPLRSMNPERLAAMQTSVSQELQTIWSKAPTVFGARTTRFTLHRGDTLADVLERAGLDRNTAASLVQAVHQIYNPKKLQAGQSVEISYDPIIAQADPAPTQLAFEIAPGHRVAVDRVDGIYEARNIVAATHHQLSRVEGTITSSLFEAAEEQHLPAEVLTAVVRLFSYDVDFQRDIQKGDRFAVLYDREITGEGRTVRNGGIRYASMTVGGSPLKLFAFPQQDGSVEFYNEKGEGVRKALMRTPVNGATLTSGFGMRKHPILGYSIMHRGVDFGAPIGTPIMAAGDGTIDKRETSSTYGNYIRIRHGGGYWTAYGHMSRFGGGITSGKRVHQGDIIGYVGATGRATGPHLHFEVLRDMEQVNPISVKFPAAEKLEGTVLARFRTERAATEQDFARAGDPQVAAAE